MICEKILGKIEDFDPTGKKIEYIDIEWAESTKKVHRKQTESGLEVGLRMDDSVLVRGLYEGDVIYAASLAVKFGLTIEDLTETLAPYLTMAEGLKLVALTFDKDISKLSCCAG